MRNSSVVRIFGLLSFLLLAFGSAYGQNVVSENSAFIKIRLVRAKEIQSATIVTAIDGVPSPILSYTSGHVMAYTYKHMTGNDLTGESSFGSSGGGGGGLPAEETALVEARPGGPGGNPGGGSGSATTSYWISIPAQNDGSCLQGFLQDTNLTFQPYQYISLLGRDTSQSLESWWSNPTTPKKTGLKVKLAPGQEVTVCYYRPGHTILPTGTGQVMVTSVRDGGLNAMQQPTFWIGQQEVWYDLKRFGGFEDGSIDSRTGYGQPNREGQLPADPNSELRNFNFGDWIYKGGMFLGHRQASSGDRSGTSRIQFWEPTVEVNKVPRMTVITAFQFGKPTGVNGSIEFGFYCPLPGGATLGEDSATWGTKWDVVPRASIPSGGSYEINKDPFRTVTTDNTSDKGLISFNYTKVYDKILPDPNLPGGTLPRTFWETPNGPGICFAIHNEQFMVDNYWDGWRYFASKEFQPTYTSAHPYTFVDVAPRVWRFYISGSEILVETIVIAGSGGWGL